MQFCFRSSGQMDPRLDPEAPAILSKDCPPLRLRRAPVNPKAPPPTSVPVVGPPESDNPPPGTPSPPVLVLTPTSPVTPPASPEPTPTLPTAGPPAAVPEVVQGRPQLVVIDLVDSPEQSAALPEGAPSAPLRKPHNKGDARGRDNRRVGGSASRMGPGIRAESGPSVETWLAESGPKVQAWAPQSRGLDPQPSRLGPGTGPTSTAPAWPHPRSATVPTASRRRGSF